IQPAPGNYILSIEGNLYTREVNGNPVNPTPGVAISLVRANLVDGRIAITQEDYEAIADEVWDELRYEHTGEGSFGEGFAWGNVLGIYEVLIKSGLAGQCIVVPRGTKNSQILDIVRLFLEANPSRRQQPSLVLVFVALSQTYPISDVDENGLCPHGF
ncbi:MAG: hypothetical protein VW518_11825, partial [Burkholderiaceae bacterium]